MNEPITGETSDGFHTFNELYRHRMLLNAALFSAWHKLDGEGIGPEADVHKSRLHSDGRVPFAETGGGWFIVVAQLPAGQISYHYPLEHWDLFQIPERERATEWDRHTSADVVARLTEHLTS